MRDTTLFWIGDRERGSNINSSSNNVVWNYTSLIKNNAVCWAANITATSRTRYIQQRAHTSWHKHILPTVKATNTAVVLAAEPEEQQISCAANSAVQKAVQQQARTTEEKPSLLWNCCSTFHIPHSGLCSCSFYYCCDVLSLPRRLIGLLIIPRGEEPVPKATLLCNTERRWYCCCTRYHTLPTHDCWLSELPTHSRPTPPGMPYRVCLCQGYQLSYRLALTVIRMLFF